MTPSTPGTRRFVASYRFQLTADDDFAAATRLVPYLRTLGVSHLYLSPIAEAEEGSMHGYDITDPTKVRGELGGLDGFDRLCGELDEHGLGLILDIVPNHLSIASPEANPWFWDVLRHGTKSTRADAFDIDWEGGGGSVVLPVLTQPLEAEIPHLFDATSPDGPVIVLSTGMRLPVDQPTEGLDAAAIATLLARQPYRLVEWQSDERNQRRFFEIDSLAGVAVEDESVRRARHALLSRLLERWPQVIDGVRVDHVDGLAHPDEYLIWLRQFIGSERLLLVEKIVVESEDLPERWPVDGTTGYEFARLVDRMLVDNEGLEQMRNVWTMATGETASYTATEHAAINEVLGDRLHPEVERIHRLVEDDPLLAGDDGKDAIIALTTSLGRYRTYLPYGGDDDRALIEASSQRAQAANPSSVPAIARLCAILSAPDTEPHEQAQTLFQQLTGPALAKGGEDRALYRYLPMAALNEVGGDPGNGAATPADFHRWAAATARTHPRTMLATSTHDTKRSGDVRARLLALSHHPALWQSLTDTWLPKIDLHPGDALLLLQSAIGAWPLTEQRLSDYLIKALREAALRSSWIEPDAGYEAAVLGVVAVCLADDSLVADIESVVDAIEERAAINTLTQTLLRLTAPGFGDLYRGDEVRDLSLVDPDNRRALDWHQLELTSAASEQFDLPTALKTSLDLAKLALIRRTLACRRASASNLDYEAVASTDANVLAYRRGDLLIVVDLGGQPSLPSATLDLPDGRWTSVLRDDQVAVSGAVDLHRIVDDSLPIDLLAR